MRRLPAVCLLLCFLLTACSHAAEPIQVSHSGSGAYEAALATDEKGFAVAWYDTRDGNPEIYMRLLDDSGRPSGPERRLTETPDASYEASLERLGDSFAIAWYEQTSDGRQTAMLGEWNRDGSQKWVQAIAPASRNPVIVTDGQAIIAAWIQAEPDSSEWVYMGTWDRDGRESRDAHPGGRCFEDYVESQYRSRWIRGVDCLRCRRVDSCERTVSCARGGIRCPPRPSDERRWGGVEVSGLED